MVRFIVGFFATVLAVLIVLAVWLGFTGWQAKQAADGFQAEVALAAVDGAAGQVVDSMARLPTIADHAQTLDRTLNSAPWTWAKDLPVVGDSVQALGVISQATARTLDAAASSDLATSSLSGALDVRLLEEAANGLDEMSQVAAVEAEQVRQIDPELMVPTFRSQIATARAQFLDLAAAVDGAAGAAHSLPVVLGYQGKRSWLVILQNTSEARGTGGLIGAYTIGDMENGRFSPSVADSNNSLVGAQISTKGVPVDTRRLWGEDLSYMWGLNLDRHYPFAAKLMPRVLPPGSPKIDDVISLDPAAVAALLEMTGPATSHGVAVTSATAEDFFTNKVYEMFPVTAEKDAVVVDMLTAVLAKLSEVPIDLPKVWAVLAPVADQERLLIASNSKAVQKQLERMPTGGVVPTSPGPWATVAVNDFAGSKMDAFVKVDVRYESASLCPTDSGVSKFVVTAENNARQNLPTSGNYDRQDPGSGPEGSTKINIAMYAPVGSELKSSSIDGGSGGVELGSSRSHPVWKRSLALRRGETRTIEVEFDEPYWPRLTPVMQPQPMVQDMTVSVVKPSSC